MSAEHQLLCITQLLLTVGILAFALWGWQAFKWACRWVGAKVATVFFGREPGGRR